MQYKTSKEFLLRFGLNDLNELPSMSSNPRSCATGASGGVTPRSTQSSSMTAGLLVLAWANLIVPLVLALAAVLVTLVRRVRRRRAAARASRVARAEEDAADAPGDDADIDAGVSEPVLTATARQEPR